MTRIGEYAWGPAALSWLYRELGRCAFRVKSSPSRDHIGDIGGWMALVQAWALERFTSIARRLHMIRQIAPTNSHPSSASSLACGIDRIEFRVSLGWISMSLLMIIP
ncbi:hypothetical protein LINPERHAP2_LOCUS33006 [Linum perenne]